MKVGSCGYPSVDGWVTLGRGSDGSEEVGVVLKRGLGVRIVRTFGPEIGQMRTYLRIVVNPTTVKVYDRMRTFPHKD